MKNLQIRSLALAALAAVAFCAPVRSGTLTNYEVNAKAASKYDFSALRERLKKAVDSGELPGASVLVMHRGKVVFKEAYGLIDVENRRPFRTDSVCHIASSSKWVSEHPLLP